MRAALLLCCLLLAGCDGMAGDGVARRLRIDVVGPADGPLAAQLHAATGAGLVSSDAAGAPVPGLAGSWSQTRDGLSLILKLRPASWSDGAPLRAEQVVASFRRLLARRSANPLKLQLQSLDGATAAAAGRAPAALVGVAAPLPDTVEFRTSVPTPELLRLLALPDAVVVRRDGGAGLGPFVAAPAPGDGAVALARNPRYFAAATVELDALTLASAEPAAAVARFRRGETDIVLGDGIAGLAEARTLGDRSALRVEPSWGVYGYAVNTVRGRLADARVRRALAMAIDRDALIARQFAISSVEPVLGPVPPGLADDVAAAPDWAALSLAERRSIALRLLDSAGYGSASPLVIRALLPAGREHARILAAVAADWRALNVVVTSDVLPPAGLDKARRAGDFELMVVERTAPLDSAMFFLLPFTCAVAKPNYCNPGADSLIETSRNMPDPGSRDATLAQAAAAIGADTPLIPLFVPVRWALVAPHVTGWTANRAGLHPLARLSTTRSSPP